MKTEWILEEEEKEGEKEEYLLKRLRNLTADLITLTTLQQELKGEELLALDKALLWYRWILLYEMNLTADEAREFWQKGEENYLRQWLIKNKLAIISDKPTNS